MTKNIACFILAAGKSTRMKSELPKVLHPVCGRPMLSYVHDLAKGLKIKNTVVVLGHKYDKVGHLVRSAGFKVALQKKLLGTADAVKTALASSGGFNGNILILYGDIPLLKTETLKKLLDHHLKNSPDATLLTAETNKPKGYGRILRDEYTSICGIIEEKDADDFQKEIKEINTGIIVFKKASLVRALKAVKANNRKKEFYLTDTIGIICKNGGLIESVKIKDVGEAAGINSRQELAEANRIMRKRINARIMESGVTLVDPDTAYINFGTKIGQDTVIYPFTVIENNVKIGKHCQIGPFIHLREGTRLKDDCLIGNFVEIVRSSVDSGTFMKHFSYLGDSVVGRSVNIGAGTVTANFDGKQKNTTVIRDGAFIGSDSVIVAPAKIGRSAITGAGSVVTRNSVIADGVTVAGVPARPMRKKDRL